MARLATDSATSKPPYKRATMREIMSGKYNGLRVASLFSGCGGSSLGYRMAGYRVMYANEFVPAAQETYRANFPKTTLDVRDVRDVKGVDILDAVGVARGALDLLDGSPPCASFSLAGARQGGWGREKAYSDTKQRTDDLFNEYARLLDETRPRAFVAENVPGLAVGAAVGYYREIKRLLESVGYIVDSRILDAQWLGVPQSRRRLFFVGVRSDLNRSPVFPAPLPYSYTAADACPDITHVFSGGWHDARKRAAYTVVQSDGKRKNTTARFSSYLVKDKDGKTRKYTIDELRAVCGFPTDFVLTGSQEQQWERLGRAVMPPVMRAIATKLADEVLL